MGKMERLEHADAIEQGMMDIGAASRASGVSVKMIRHYEAIGLLPRVARTYANYRVYSANDVHMLRFIKRARTLGFPMSDIAELVSLWRNKSRSSAAVKKLAGKHVEELKRKVAELNAMLGTLQDLMRHCHGDNRPECPIIEGLAQ